MRTASPAQIRGFLLAFARVEWPASKDVALALADECGWSVTLQTRRGVFYETGLATNDPQANALIRPDEATGGTVDDLTVHVSDEESGARAALSEAFKDVRASVEQELGPAAHVDQWENPRAVWELNSGGRLVVQRLSAVVMMKVLSRDLADLEREEARLGVDPNRVPGTGHEDL